MHDHFADASKMIGLAKSAQREVEELALDTPHAEHVDAKALLAGFLYINP